MGGHTRSCTGEWFQRETGWRVERTGDRAPGQSLRSVEIMAVLPEVSLFLLR
jgi:hypothetical protein